MMQSFSCHTGPVFHPPDQVFMHCSDSFSSFLNHIYAKRDRWVSGQWEVSQHGKINWLQTKYSNMYEANRIQLQQEQHTQVWMYNGIRVCWGAAEVSRFHSSLTVTKVGISASHRGHVRPHTCLWNDLTAVTQHFHITCLTTCTYRMFLHSWRPAKRSGLQSSSRPTNKAKCQPRWEQLLFEIRLFSPELSLRLSQGLCGYLGHTWLRAILTSRRRISPSPLNGDVTCWAPFIGPVEK